MARRLALLAALLVVVAGMPAAAQAPQAYDRPARTDRIPLTPAGGEGNGPSSISVVSGDGRWVGFRSYAINLVDPPPPSGASGYLLDRHSGNVERIEVGAGDTPSSPVPAGLSHDGRFVVFQSSSPNVLADGVGGVGHLYVLDRWPGPDDEPVQRVTVASDGTPADASSQRPVISADGRYVAFRSTASNLAGQPVPAGLIQAYRHDRLTGETELASVSDDGQPAQNSISSVSMSADGQVVAFDGIYLDVIPEQTNDRFEVYVRDLAAGRTERIVLTYDGEETQGRSGQPTLSADGRFVAFDSSATDILPGDTNQNYDLNWIPNYDMYVHDRLTGEMERVSVASDGTEGDSYSQQGVISADGRYVAFVSQSTNFTAADAHYHPLDWNIFVHDRVAKTTEQVNVASDGTPGNDSAHDVQISADGSVVTFTSFADNLDEGITNATANVFVRDRGPSAGVGWPDAERIDDQIVQVSGAALFPAVTLSAADDPDDDGQLGAGDVGGELTGAQVRYRPERADLYAHIALEDVPWVSRKRETMFVHQRGYPDWSGYPTVVYGLDLVVGGERWQVRAERLGPSNDPAGLVGTDVVTGFGTQFVRGDAGVSVALFHCPVQDACVLDRFLGGGFATLGVGVSLAVPLAALGVGEGTELTGLRAFSAYGDGLAGPVVEMDDVALPDAELPVRRVSVGGQDGVATDRGWFQATVPVEGAAVLAATVCLGDDCYTTPIPIPEAL